MEQQSKVYRISRFLISYRNFSEGDIELQSYVERELSSPIQQLRWCICVDPVLNCCNSMYECVAGILCCLPDSASDLCYPVKMICRYVLLGIMFCCCPKPKVEYVQLDSTVHAIDRSSGKHGTSNQRVVRPY